MYKKSSAADKIAYFDTSTRVLIVLAAAAATNTAEAANNRDLGSDSYRVSRLLKS
jgi:hypothetical protein